MALGGLLLGIIAIFLPPLSVVVRRGCGVDLLINIVLLFLGWIPAVLHAWYIIIQYPSHRERRKIERRRSQDFGSHRSRSRSTTGGSYERPHYARPGSPLPRYEGNAPPMARYTPPNVYQ